MTSHTHSGGHTARWPDEYQDVTALFEQMAALDEDDPRRRRLRDAVVTRCLPLAEHIARRFDGRGEAHDDLVQVARLGLVNSVDRFDVERGSDFVSFAVPTIMGEVRRHFRDTGWAVRVPRRMKELHLALSQAVAELSQSLGHAPTVSELAEHLDLEQEEVAQGLLAGNAYQTVSVDNTSSDRTGELSMVETLGDYDAAMDDVENHETLRPPAPISPRTGADRPHAAVLRQHDTDPDRRPSRHLADARVPVAGEDTGVTARSTR